MFSINQETVEKGLKDLFKAKFPKLKLGEIKVELVRGQHHCGMRVFVNIPGESKYNSRQLSIMFQSPNTGCGTIIMHNHAYAWNHPEWATMVKWLMQVYIDDGAGTIIATMGGIKFKTCPWLIDLGFKRIHTFDNLAHARSKDKQSIFVYSQKRDSSEPNDEDEVDFDDENDNDDDD